ncbi:Nuclear pore complex protein [Forsythia ovata]|uniref:Nuclear pore complex protein n=1 Tax=Forsythia ovata TaxID=205694 RepID=A0ABD1XBF9_9LAMI
MEPWNLLLTHTTEKGSSPVRFEELKEMDTHTIISKELLAGPKAVILPPSAPDLRSVTADSIEGRATLHQYFKLFHENYVEYAHKQKLVEVEKKQEKVESCIERAVQLHNSLEERLHNLKSLLVLHKKPLSKAEQDFKSELDRFAGVEMDALHSSIEALNARLRRHVHSPQTNFSNQQQQKSRRMASRVQEDEVSQLKSSLAKLSLLNSENTQKVKLVESALENRDISD